MSIQPRGAQRPNATSTSHRKLERQRQLLVHLIARLLQVSPVRSWRTTRAPWTRTQTVDKYQHASVCFGILAVLLLRAEKDKEGAPGDQAPSPSSRPIPDTTGGGEAPPQHNPTLGPSLVIPPLISSLPSIRAVGTLESSFLVSLYDKRKEKTAED
ncbi:unnamed protein product [Pleuronectes platessa]|uniref:Uncharacterized protein n=1 Tax=Pleuronectes platessa TaxID=8262 RepID=A0A9N7UQF8_PLEPL|nr:unnamed protein product [Pleuronectes platessa]